MPLNLFASLVEEMHCLQKLKFIIEAITVWCKTGPSEKDTVSRLAQHAALHKAYKPTVTITLGCLSISNLPL